MGRQHQRRRIEMRLWGKEGKEGQEWQNMCQGLRGIISIVQEEQPWLLETDNKKIFIYCVNSISHLYQPHTSSVQAVHIITPIPRSSPGWLKATELLISLHQWSGHQWSGYWSGHDPFSIRCCAFNGIVDCQIIYGTFHHGVLIIVV